MKNFLVNASIIVLAVIAIWQAYRLGEMHGRRDAVAQIGDVYDLSLTKSVADEYSGKYIDFEAETLENHLGEEVRIDSLLQDVVLFARFSSTACRPCMDRLMAMLESTVEANPDLKVAILLSEIPNRDLLVISKQYKDKFRFLKTNGLEIDYDNGETPLVFQIDNRGRVYNYFIFDQDDPSAISIFLNSLK